MQSLKGHCRGCKLVAKLGFFVDQSSLSRCHFETDCNIAMPVKTTLPQYGKNRHITPNISEYPGLIRFGRHMESSQNADHVARHQPVAGADHCQRHAIAVDRGDSRRFSMQPRHHCRQPAVTGCTCCRCLSQWLLPTMTASSGDSVSGCGQDTGVGIYIQSTRLLQCTAVWHI